jgi:hypothetical protein
VGIDVHRKTNIFRLINEPQTLLRRRFGVASGRRQRRTTCPAFYNQAFQAGEQYEGHQYSASRQTDVFNHSRSELQGYPAEHEKSDTQQGVKHPELRFVPEGFSHVLM